MAYTTIDKPSDYFNTKLWSGNGSTQSITGVGFAPDWVWIKNRDRTDNHVLYDSIRTATKRLNSNTTDAEATKTNGLTSFDSDGFSVGSASENNHNATNLVAWNWLAGGSASSNSNGSITSSVSANTTAGFSIVSYTGTGSSTTVGHGLGVAPSMLIFKNRDSTDSWNIQHDGLTSYDYYVRFNSTGAQNNDIDVGPTAPTSSVVTVGSHDQQNGNGNDMILYAFAEKKGYSKFGSYTGNGNADGTFVYTGFKPAWFMQKRTDAANGWHIFDTKRDTFNACERYMTANANSSEPSGTDYVDILSNGLKMRRNGNDINGSGATYIYMAFAENPFVTSTGIPTTAR